jgi:thioredoxin-dependent peroxiredoxin
MATCPSQTSQMIREGDPAPDFSLQADDGSVVTLDSVAGKNVVLFFYPKDNTAG